MLGPLVMETVAVRLSRQRETFQEWPGLVMEQMVMVDRPVMVKLWYGVGRWDVMTYNIPRICLQNSYFKILPIGSSYADMNCSTISVIASFI